jgi:hypothetical protein
LGDVSRCSAFGVGEVRVRARRQKQFGALDALLALAGAHVEWGVAPKLPRNEVPSVGIRASLNQDGESLWGVFGGPVDRLASVEPDCIGIDHGVVVEKIRDDFGMAVVGGPVEDRFADAAPAIDCERISLDVHSDAIKPTDAGGEDDIDPTP